MFMCMTMNMQTENPSTLPAHPAILHEAWALAGLMKGRYGSKALNEARLHLEKYRDDEDTRPIWESVTDCLGQ